MYEYRVKMVEMADNLQQSAHLSTVQSARKQWEQEHWIPSNALIINAPESYLLVGEVFSLFLYKIRLSNYHVAGPGTLQLNVCCICYLLRHFCSIKTSVCIVFNPRSKVCSNHGNEGRFCTEDLCKWS